MKTNLYGVRVVTVEYFRIEATSVEDVYKQFEEGFDIEAEVVEDYYIDDPHGVHLITENFGEKDETSCN